MRKFLKKAFWMFALGALLIALYSAWFFTYEPINYFGLKSHTAITYDPVWKMKDFLRNPSRNIILGNSQVAHIDPDTLLKYSGTRFSNIAFGGASLKEAIDQFWWATQVTPLDQVWFAVSFYTFNKAYNTDRITSLKEMCSNPLAFMTDKYYIELAYQQMTGKESPAAPVQPLPASGSKYRQDLIDYAEIIREACSDYTFDTQILVQLTKIGTYCKRNGIQLTFIIPPIQESIFDSVIGPLHLQNAQEKTRSGLSAISTVYDLQFINEFTADQANFHDGFHLKETAATVAYIQSLSDGRPNTMMRVIPPPAPADSTTPK